jgi:hypothetical protein
MADFDPDAYLASKKSPFDAALAAEGVTGRIADIARSIYQQESGSGKNTKTSNAGAVGGMQIIPATFNRMADKGWNINDPQQNAQAGIRYIKTLYDKAGGDPALTAAGYYGGEGAIPKAKAGIAVSDPRNPNAPDTLQYGQQVAARLPAQPTQTVVPSFDPDAYLASKTPTVAPAQPKTSLIDDIKQGAGNLAAGAVRGAGNIGQSILTAGEMLPSRLIPRVAAGGSIFPDMKADEQQRAKMDLGLQELGANPNSIAYKAGKLGGEIAGTAGVGGLMSGAARLSGATPEVIAALRSGGMSGGANLATRAGAGAAVGATSTALIDPNLKDIGWGTALGGALPAIGGLAGYAGNAAGSLVRPFFKKGQERIVGNVLRDFAENPNAARANLANSSEIVSGSMPTAATAAGDNGIASLSRAMQNADQRYASELATRQTAQNQARTAAMESIAGNTGKLDIAKAERDAATDAMRERVLSDAGVLPVDNIVSSIDKLIANPSNAGKLSQQALNEYRNSILGASKDGAIDARALYEIRKDIGTTLEGKLQGESGNLRYAAGQLKNVKGIIDDAIDSASKRIPENALPSNQMMPKTSWADYLQTYTNKSIPINQMEKLDSVLKAAQTGTVDSQGGFILSGAKLNNILKNEGDALRKSLSTEQLDILRRVSADLNAGQIANNAGRAVGSNTLQNMAQNQALTGALGQRLGGSTFATSALGNVLKLPYISANKQMQEKLGNALLDPKEAARLMADPKTNALVQMMLGTAPRAVPAIASQ